MVKRKTIFHLEKVRLFSHRCGGWYLPYFPASFCQTGVLHFWVILYIAINKQQPGKGLAFIFLVAAGNLLLGNNFWQTIFGVYIPTLIHVYIFTGAFLLHGALKSRITSGYVAVFFFLLCPVLLCVLFTSVNTSPTIWAMSNYGHFGRLNKISLRDQSLSIFTDKASILLTRVIAFAYTYHYINWFTKTEMIGWHRISITRVVIIGTIWIASVALYFYDYRLGLSWLFILSLSHVILEFPLNQRSFVGIGKELKSRVAG
jgi:hypothetical protein